MQLGMEVLGEVLQGAQDRVGGQASEGAERTVQQQLAEIVEHFEVFRTVLIGYDFVDYLDPASGSDPARGAFAAALDGAEFHGEAGLTGEIDRVVENNDAAVSEKAFMRGEGFVVERGIEKGCGEISAQRSAYLHGAEWASGSGSAAEIVDRFTQCEAECFFDQATVPDVAGELNGEGAARPAHAEIAVKIRAFIQNNGDGGERDDVIHYGRLAE